MMHMTGQATIAEEARAILARRQVKHAQMAEAIGLSRSQLSRRLTGEIEFSGSEIAGMAEYLAVPAGAFFGECAA